MEGFTRHEKISGGPNPLELAREQNDVIKKSIDEFGQENFAKKLEEKTMKKKEELPPSSRNFKTEKDFIKGKCSSAWPSPKNLNYSKRTLIKKSL